MEKISVQGKNLLWKLERVIKWRIDILVAYYEYSGNDQY